MRAGAVVAIVVVLALGAAGAVIAQQPAPTVTVTASASSVVVGATTLPAGPTRFEIVKSGAGPLDINIAALRTGVSVSEFTATLHSNPDAALELVHIDGGASLTPSGQRHAVTFDLRPSSTYVVANTTGEDPSDWEVTTFTVSGASNGAAAPQADASVRMIDLRFRGDSTLPLDGVVRFENSGWAPHFAVTAPLRRGASARATRRALRRNNERRVSRLVNFGAAIEPQAVITRGAVDYNEVQFPRRGRYLMICFFEGHNAQGMYRLIRVR